MTSWCIATLPVPTAIDVLKRHTHFSAFLRSRMHSFRSTESDKSHGTTIDHLFKISCAFQGLSRPHEEHWGPLESNCITDDSPQCLTHRHDNCSGLLMTEWECDRDEAIGQERQWVAGQLQLCSTSNLLCVKYNPVISAPNVTSDPSWIFVKFFILLQTYDIIFIYCMHTCNGCYSFIFLVWSCFRNMRCSLATDGTWTIFFPLPSPKVAYCSYISDKNVTIN